MTFELINLTVGQMTEIRALNGIEKVEWLDRNTVNVTVAAEYSKDLEGWLDSHLDDKDWRLV